MAVLVAWLVFRGYRQPELLLDFRDRRTLTVFLARAGSSFPDLTADPVGRYLEEQLFIPYTNQGLRLLVDAFRTGRFGDTIAPLTQSGS